MTGRRGLAPVQVIWDEACIGGPEPLIRWPLIEQALELYRRPPPTTWVRLSDRSTHPQEASTG